MRVKGIYDGNGVVRVDPLPIAANTPVEVVFTEATGEEAAYWQTLAARGLVATRPEGPVGAAEAQPVTIEGEPLSKTIVDQRR